MSGSLKGKVAVVTGASGGIGSAVARRLAKDGASVVVHYNRNKAPADALVEELKAAGTQAVAAGGDVSTPEGAKAVADAAVSAFGKIDILVNLAGTLAYLPFGEITPDQFHEQINSSTLSTLMMMQAAVPHFPAEGGRIVNMATNIAQSPLPGTAIYCAAKAAVAVMTLGFAKELGPKNITVNAIAAGAIETKMLDWLTDDVRQGIISSTPLGRMGQPEDAADAMAFFASDDSRWITGRTVILDGGLI